MTRRGDELRAHILWAAKDVFLELGFERASMDEVAARAQTSKRSLYAHFGSKEKLYVAVVELVRELYLDRVRTPADYSADPREATVLFLARVKQLVLWESVVRTCRMAISEAERLPDASRDYFDVMFGTAQTRLAEFLAGEFELEETRAAALAAALMARTLYPGLLRTLFAVDAPRASRGDGDAPDGPLELAPIRAVVDEVLAAAAETADPQSPPGGAPR